MPTRFAPSELMDRIVAALSAQDPIAEKVYRHRVKALPDNVSRALVVRFERSRTDQRDLVGAPIDWDTDIRVTAFARLKPGEFPDVVAGALLAAAHARVTSMPLADTDSGLQQSIDIDSDDEDLDETQASLSCIYTFTHQTEANSLTVPTT